MSDQRSKKGGSGIKTVDLQTVKIARNLAITKNSPASERAEFAKKLVEESISRSSALFPQTRKANVS